MAYGLTQSIVFAAASSQSATRANTGSTGLAGNSTNFTWETWVKYTTIPGTNQQMILAGKWGSSNSYLFRLQNVAGAYSYIINTSGGNYAASISAPSTGIWYHIACVYTLSGTTAEWFVNGSSIGSGNAGSVSSGTDSFRLAAADDGGPYLNGQLSLMRFWTTTRSSAQLLANQCSVLGTTTNLSAEWTLNNTYNDNSGNSNTLTASNSPTFTANIPGVCAPATLPELRLAFI